MIFTHPGKFGDLLWALPTVRALGGGLLWLPETLRPIEALLRQQPYIQDVVFDETWQVQDTAPATPRIPPGAQRLESPRHLGYPAWPDRPLPEYVAHLHGCRNVTDQPWITLPKPSLQRRSYDILGHFTDRWFELKYGAWQLLVGAVVARRTMTLAYAPNSRWLAEGVLHREIPEHAPGWVELASHIATSRLVVTDNSAVMVLCAALQTTPCVVIEPETARHHPIFWPGIQGGDDGPERWRPREPLCRWIHPLLGNDGRPTFDSRHLVDTVERLLRAQPGDTVERLLRAQPGEEADRGC